MTKLFLTENYRAVYPDLKGQTLTDALVKDVLIGNGYIESEDKWDEMGLRIHRLPGGKPILAGCPDGSFPEVAGKIHFSVSHTDDVFGCAVSDEAVGLDLQLARPLRMQRLAERYFNPDEIEYLQEDASCEQRFFRLWTRKEAYAKYTGAGLQAVLEKAPVLGRRDTVFTDMYFGDGLYGCICSNAGGSGQEV